MQRLFILLLLLLSSFIIRGQFLSDEEIERYEQIVQTKGDSSAHAAYKLAIHYKRKGNEVEKYKHYCLLIIEITKDNPETFEHLRALRSIGIIYLQSSKTDSMNYYMDRIIGISKNSKEQRILRFCGMAYNIKAGEHLYITNDYDKAYPLLRKAMEVAETIENSDDYLGAAYSLCNLIYSSEAHKIPGIVKEIEQKVKKFEHSPRSKYSLLKVQKYRYLIWAKDTTQSSEKRAEALTFYRSLIQDFQEDNRIGEAYSDMAEMALLFKKELGQDSVLQITEKVYDFFKKNGSHQLLTPLYSLHAEALYDKKLYLKAIPVFKEILGLLAREEEINATEDSEKLLGDYATLSNTYKFLAESYFNIGNSKVAQEYFQKFVEAAENKQIQAVDNAVSDLEVKYDVEKKEIENAALLSENNLIQTRFRLSSFIGLLLLSLLGVSIFFFIKMRKSKEELERINEGKNQLFAIVAHDLKGPISSFSNLSFNVSHLIKNKQYDDLQSIGEYYEKAGRKINYILVNLLDWAISQKDHFVHEPQQVDIKAEVNKIIEELSYSLGQKGIKVENQVSSNQSILFDKNAFKIIVRNLLHNAVKFSHQDSTVVIDYDRFGLKIKDSGIGMEPATIQKIMKSQRVVSVNGTNAEKGNGIGLSTCLKLAEQNSAKLQIESKHGEGTIFTLIAD